MGETCAVWTGATTTGAAAAAAGSTPAAGVLPPFILFRQSLQIAAAAAPTPTTTPTTMPAMAPLESLLLGLWSVELEPLEPDDPDDPDDPPPDPPLDPPPEPPLEPLLGLGDPFDGDEPAVCPGELFPVGVAPGLLLLGASPASTLIQISSPATWAWTAVIYPQALLTQTAAPLLTALALLHSQRVSPNLQFVNLVTAEAMQAVAHAGIVGSARASIKSPRTSREGPGVMNAAAGPLERCATGVGRVSA